MGPLVPGQSFSMMTSDSNATNSRTTASTRQSSSSTVVKVVSCFFCGSETHRNRSLCPARNMSCQICGKRSFCSCLSVQRFIKWFCFGCYHCACPVCAPTLPCFCSIEFRIRRLTWDVEWLACTGSHWLWGVWKLCRLWCLLSIELTCEWRQVFNRHGFVSNFCWNPWKDHGRFNSPWPYLPII